jgi:1-acyl-sn-glycerol-3-phosphate acyltransferase
MPTFEDELRRIAKPIRRFTDIALFLKKLDVRGVENFVRTGPNIIVGNHIGSFKDVAVLLQAVPRPIFFTANEQLFSRDEFSALVNKHLQIHLRKFAPLVHMLFGPFNLYAIQYISSHIAAVGSIPVNLEGNRTDALRKCEAYLRDGRAVIALQGWGRIDDTDPIPYVRAFRKGPAVMAYHLYEENGISVPVTPLSIFGAHILWGVPVPIRVNVGPPMYIKDHLAADSAGTIEKFRSALEKTVVRLLRDSLHWET